MEVLRAERCPFVIDVLRELRGQDDFQEIPPAAIARHGGQVSSPAARNCRCQPGRGPARPSPTRGKRVRARGARPVSGTRPRLLQRSTIASLPSTSSHILRRLAVDVQIASMIKFLAVVVSMNSRQFAADVEVIFGLGRDSVRFALCLVPRAAQCTSRVPRARSRIARSAVPEEECSRRITARKFPSQV